MTKTKVSRDVTVKTVLKVDNIKIISDSDSQMITICGMLSDFYLEKHKIQTLIELLQETLKTVQPTIDNIEGEKVGEL